MKFLILFGIYFLNSTDPAGENALLRDARAAYTMGNYEEAKSNYQELIRINPNSLDYNFELALSIFHSGIGRENALIYFDKALELDTKHSIPEILYYSAEANHFCGNYDKAANQLRKFKNFIDLKKGAEISGKVDLLLATCENAVSVDLKMDSSIIVVNMGTRINSSFDEYAPIARLNGAEIIYTARKKEPAEGKKSGSTGYFEDIFIAKKNGNSWNESVAIDTLLLHTPSSAFNNDYHNAGIALNHSEDKLYIYKFSDIYESTLNHGEWSKPEKIRNELDAGFHEPSLFLSADEKTIIFVSNRKGGLGGRDLFIATKGQDGKWSDPSALNDKINTPFDDDAPFLSADGNTLYFSSKGHKSIGGFDIFKSQKDENGNWSEPVNLGMPVNSPADDIFYVTTAHDSVVFFSSNRVNGLGGMDIYSIEKVEKPIQILASNHSNNENSLQTVENGLVENASDTTLSVGENSSNANGNSNSKSETAIANDSGDSKNMPFHAEKINEKYQKFFGYNAIDLSDGDADYLGFLNKIAQTINQNTNVNIYIESSASCVPTTTFTSNEILAKTRAEKTRDRILNDLKNKNIDLSKVSFILEPKVQGPAYKNDFDTNKEEYTKYQYISVSIR